MPSAMSNVKSGRLRPVAVTGLKRSSALPDLPTVAESGLPGFETSSWQGLFAPAGTSPAIVNKLYREVAAVVRLPEIVAALAQDGSEPVASTPEAFAKWLPGELAKWVKVARAAKITAE
jgi:tripartite-type tricarboxylate transporter receptor subunit TctC